MVFQVLGSRKNSTSTLYSNTTERENFSDKKKAEIANRSNAYKGYGSSYYVVILNSFNPELQLKETLNLQN